MERKNQKTVTTMGLALFAMFFGAGNLIFPPFMGYQLGEDWVVGTIGYAIMDAEIGRAHV